MSVPHAQPTPLISHATRALCAAVSALLACAAPTGSGNGPAATGMGSGIWLHWNVDARPLRSQLLGAEAFAAAVIGLRTVEVLRRTTNGFVSTPLPQPTGRSTPCALQPTTLEVVDLNDDTVDDVLVSDSMCGLWAAYGNADGSFSARAELPFAPLPPFRHLVAVDADGDGDRDLLTATSAQLTLVEHAGSGSWGVPITAEFPPPYVTNFVTRPALALGSGLSFAFQRGEYFSLLSVENSATGRAFGAAVTAVRETESEGPTVSVYDLVAETPWLRSCGTDAVAVRRIPSRSGAIVGGRAVAVGFRGGVHAERELISGTNVSALVALPGATSESALVAAFTLQEDGDYLSLLRIRGCAAPEVLRSQRVDFSWRTIDAPPGNFDVRLAHAPGVRVIGFGSESEGVDLVHYDGFDVRSFHLSAGSGWTIEARVDRIHENRTDTVW